MGVMSLWTIYQEDLVGDYHNRFGWMDYVLWCDNISRYRILDIALNRAYILPLNWMVCNTPRRLR